MIYVYMMVVDMAKLEQLKDLVDNNQTFAIFGHKSIDGDAIGSALGLGTVLEKLGKNVRYFTSTEPAKTYAFVPGIDKISIDFDYGQYDVMFFVDFSPLDRIPEITEGFEEYFAIQNLVVIDHHLGDVPSATVLEIKDVHATSNCEWIYEHLKALWPEHIDAQVATYLYLGLTTDSGNFIYDTPEQSPRMMNNALELLRLGADKKFILDNVFYNKSFKSVAFMQTVLSRMKLYKYNIVATYCSDQELTELGLDGFESGYSLPLIQSIHDVDVVLYFKHNFELGFSRLSLRAKGKYNVAKLAEHRGGGGHYNAAGAMIKVPDRDFDKAVLEVVDIVVQGIERQIG